MLMTNATVRPGENQGLEHCVALDEAEGNMKQHAASFQGSYRASLNKRGDLIILKGICHRNEFEHSWRSGA